jgi:hypothetical protein
MEMGEWVIRSLTTRFPISIALIIASRETNGLALVGKPGAEDSRNNGTILSDQVMSIES